MFRPSLAPASEITGVIQEMFTRTGTKPGKISLVIPDNVAKISLLSLPERPPTRRQLEEILRFKLRRSVPFRMDDAVISYQVIPAEGKAVNILVALMHRLVVEQFEAAVRATGARPGLVDLCTPNLLNLCRRELDELNSQGHDAALLNCAGPYFSLVIIREGRIIFFRSKSLHGSGAEGAEEIDTAVLARELNHSLAYYQEKLAGSGIHTLMVRTVAASNGILPALEGLGFGTVKAVDPAGSLEIASGLRMEAAMAQRLAPAVSAATGRGR
jgi:type IV pilus assembly protein PilM